MRDGTVVFVNGSMCVGAGVRVRVSQKNRGHDSAKVGIIVIKDSVVQDRLNLLRHPAFCDQ